MKKVALVTGASSGIGKAIARRLVKDGLTVYVAARRTELMDDLVADGAISLALDITNDEAVQKTVAEIIKHSGKIDVLVNNAGYAVYGSVEETTIADARRQFDVNLFGLANLTQLVIPHMREKASGKIINISSVGGKIYTPLGAWYHASKHALEGWSDCLRLELKSFGIYVVIIEPGGIQSEFGDVMSAPLRKRSGSGPYKNLAEAVIRSTEYIYQNKKAKGSPPEVIADVVARAISSSRPKTRYVKGYMGKLVLFMRRWISDRIFDKAIMSQLR